MNIRWTDTTEEATVRKEFSNGEADKKFLSIVHSAHLSKGNLTFVNVVAALNVSKTAHNDVCGDCLLLDGHVWSSGKRRQQFFYSLLQQTIAEPTKYSKEEYMNMLGQMMCFMATRNGLYAVPTAKEDVHEKIRTLILSSQQLRCLHNCSKKKIIIGSLGSGKTVLALAHLELYYRRYTTESVIYYVLWSDETLLLSELRKVSE